MREEYEAKCAAALEIALDAGVLERCRAHDFIFEGLGDIQQAHELGGGRLSAGALGSCFESHDEMSEFINEIVSNHRMEECPRCAEKATERASVNAAAGAAPST
jgi:hypothetical protein